MLSANRQFFLILCLVYFLSMTILIWLLPKGTEILFCHKQSSSYLILFFKNITRLGEWISLIILGLILIIKNKKIFFATAISFITFDMLVIGLKKYLNAPRPLLYFQPSQLLPIENLTPLYHQSMPSGHTYTGFFIASFLCFFFDLSIKFQLILFSLACLIGFSRIFLLCHFLEDVLIGSVIGIVAGILPFFIYSKYYSIHAD